MRIEGDGRQYWLVLNPDTRKDQIDRILDRLRELWYNTPELSLGQLLHTNMTGNVYNMTNDGLEENL